MGGLPASDNETGVDHLLQSFTFLHCYVVKWHIPQPDILADWLHYKVFWTNKKQETIIYLPNYFEFTSISANLRGRIDLLYFLL